MRLISQALSDKFSSFRPFFNSRWYVLAVSAIVLVGHVAAIEYYLNIINVVMFCLALLTCNTAKPAVPFVLSFVYQISVKHAPAHPNFSSYYFEGWRLVLVAVLAAMLVISLCCFIVRTRIFSGIGIKSTPLLIPLLVLSLSFVLNGAFSGKWCYQSLLYGLAQAVVYTLIFLFFYFGLKGENASELLDYFVFVSGALAVILIGEVGALYFTADNLIVDGSIVKESIIFGWGIWNSAGVALAVLIPMCYLGAYRSQKPYAYLALSLLTLAATVLTLSRNAILFGGICFVACAIICCFGKHHRTVFRCYFGIGLLLCLAGAFLLRDKLSSVLADLLNRGFSDNGRYELWKIGIDNFLGAPIFGAGFFAFVSETFDTAVFLPDMAHPTFVQLLSAMGVFGLAAYAYYRIATLRPFFKRPSMDKLFLFISVAVLLLESMLDNFIFYFLPIFHYTVSIVIALMLNGQEETASRE